MRVEWMMWEFIFGWMMLTVECVCVIGVRWPLKLLYNIPQHTLQTVGEENGLQYKQSRRFREDKCSRGCHFLLITAKQKHASQIRHDASFKSHLYIWVFNDIFDVMTYLWHMFLFDCIRRKLFIHTHTYIYISFFFVFCFFCVCKYECVY